MKKPFVFTSWTKGNGISEIARKRLNMPMRDQVKQCEWLYEASDSCPEQSLGIAVLQRAVLDLITPGVKERDRSDAEQWISGQLGEEFERTYAMSFSRIVESFTAIPVDEFRHKLLAWVSTAKTSKENADGFRFQRG